MISDKVPHLTGGILFNLFLQTLKPQSIVRHRDKLFGKESELKESDIFAKLLSVIFGQITTPNGGSFPKNTSQYKSCSINKTTYIELDKTIKTKAFIENVQNKNPDTLKMMSEFIDDTLNISLLEKLSKMIIETINKDVSISTDIKFETTSNVFENKNELINTKK